MNRVQYEGGKRYSVYSCDGYRPHDFRGHIWFIYVRDDSKKTSYLERHRELGPAVESECGTKNEWYLHGQKIKVKSQEEFKRYLKLKAFI